MYEIGFLHPEQAPTPELQGAYPSDIPLVSVEE